MPSVFPRPARPTGHLVPLASARRPARIPSFPCATGAVLKLRREGRIVLRSSSFRRRAGFVIYSRWGLRCPVLWAARGRAAVDGGDVDRTGPMGSLFSRSIAYDVCAQSAVGKLSKFCLIYAS